MTISSIPMPWADSFRGSTSIRTAYFWGPNTWTCATPFTIEMRCEIVESAYSFTVESGNVGERRTRNITG